MTKTQSRSKIKYKKTLCPNLLMACIASEYTLKEHAMHPKLVAKELPQMRINPQDGQQTFVMRWNPEISSYKVRDFESAMEDFYTDGFYFDWSIWDHEKVHVGDRFYMLKVGNGNTGIVMSGTIASLPSKDEDWSGQGRDVRYVRMLPDCMVHPARGGIVSTRELDEALPGVNWNEGHSGVLLSEEQTRKFNELWSTRLNR